jgi:hypothetical protein
MKKILLFSVCFLLQVAIVFADAYAKNSTSLAFGCAPWDGLTLDLKITNLDSTYEISIWAKGYEDLQSGKRTVVIDNRELSPSSRDTTGKALETTNFNLLGSKYSPIELKVHFDELDLKVGGKASGWIQKPDGVKYPFQGTIITGVACG